MMKVKRIVCNEFAENCYLAYDETSQDAVIIDPGIRDGSEWENIRRSITEKKLTIRNVLLTHFHLDHVMGCGYFLKEYGAEVCGSLEDMLGLPPVMQQGMLFGLEVNRSVPRITRDLKDGDYIECGSLKFQVLDCPGHSFHGLCFYSPDEKIIFTGDVLFLGSIGRTDFVSMGGDHNKLVSSIKSKLMNLPEDVTVFPGHGPRTSIGFEIQNNPYI